MVNYEEVYLDKLAVMESLQTYASPRSKLTRLLQAEELLHIRRGLYIPAHMTYSLKTLANVIYGPSYISFEFALSHYGYIPERVVNITSATYGKNKHKRFDTPVGSFIYRSVPQAVYHMEMRRIEENGSPYLIATAEKAICDTLYQYRQVQSLKGLGALLFEDLRIDRSALKEIDPLVVLKLVPFYGKKVLRLFASLLGKGL